MAGLIVQGRSSYAEVNLFRNDPLFQQALGFDTVYAPETIRIYLDRLAGRFTPYVLSALETVNMNLFGRVQMTPIKTEIGQYLPVVISMSLPWTIQELKKKEWDAPIKGVMVMPPSSVTSELKDICSIVSCGPGHSIAKKEHRSIWRKISKLLRNSLHLTPSLSVWTVGMMPLQPSLFLCKATISF